MKFPIERIPGTIPPQFVYHQMVDAPNGAGIRAVEHRSCILTSMEQALCELLDIVEKLAKENEELKA